MALRLLARQHLQSLERTSLRCQQEYTSLYLFSSILLVDCRDVAFVLMHVLMIKRMLIYSAFTLLISSRVMPHPSCSLPEIASQPLRTVSSFSACAAGLCQ